MEYLSIGQFKTCKERRRFFSSLAIGFDLPRDFALSINEPTAIVDLLRKAHTLSPAVLEAVLLVCALSEDETCRGIAAHSTYTPKEVLAHLFEDESEMVRIALAARASLSRRLRQKLLRDRSPAVRIAVLQTSDVSDEEISVGLTGSAEVREVAIARGSFPDKRYDELIRDPSPRVRRKLAELSLTPARIVNSLAHDIDPEVRESVALSEKANLETLLILWDDKRIHVRAYARMTMRKRFPETAKKLEST